MRSKRPLCRLGVHFYFISSNENLASALLSSWDTRAVLAAVDDFQTLDRDVHHTFTYIYIHLHTFLIILRILIVSFVKRIQQREIRKKVSNAVVITDKIYSFICKFYLC